MEVEGKAFCGEGVSDGGDISQLTAATPSSALVQAAPAGAGSPVTAGAAGGQYGKVIATEALLHAAEGACAADSGSHEDGTEIRAAQAGTVRGIAVKSGDAVPRRHPDDAGVTEN